LPLSAAGHRVHHRSRRLTRRRRSPRQALFTLVCQRTHFHKLLKKWRKIGFVLHYPSQQ
jgi:hypothetical protein